MKIHFAWSKNVQKSLTLLLPIQTKDTAKYADDTAKFWLSCRLF